MSMHVAEEPGLGGLNFFALNALARMSLAPPTRQPLVCNVHRDPCGYATTRR